MSNAMELSGREYTFDYGDMVLLVRYLSDSRLAWTQVKGPEAGSQGEQDFLFARVRPGIVRTQVAARRR